MCLHGLIFIDACIESCLVGTGFKSADKHDFLRMKNSANTETIFGGVMP